MHFNTAFRPLAALLALGCIGLSPAAFAGDYPCPPNRGAVTIDGNVVVKGICNLNGTKVKGNVLVYSGGTLTATGALIDGNVQAKDANAVTLRSSYVKGDVQAENLRGSPSYIEKNRVDGNIQLKSNRRTVAVRDNVVDGDVQAFSNTGGLIIARNTIDGNLQCKSNTPAPTGGNNRVSGNKEDQCRRL
ncbi:hypothetical protein [Thiocapsa rosea]|uniref:Polymer-forming protein n=1 Tax=Thiocapsa rosea TaxID=69360 RepID=A0A495VAX6_9GAMM|nr:hypothetical protein [Thiocapsa rosea]RKT45783.1 hypothetical protein BDD21_3258 [Thiocapsa rosea]